MPWQDKIRDPNCTLCPLHEGAQHVCLMGTGPKKVRIMVVGEAPGQREDETHRAFVGPAGQLLNELLTEVGLDRDELYITNAAKCRPANNRTPERPELKICAETFLIQEIRKVRPQHILLLGNSALRAVAKRSGITKHRGQVFNLQFEGGGATGFATYHPAYILRYPQHRADLGADLHRFSRLVRGDASKVSTVTKIIRTVSQLNWLTSRLEEADIISYDIETKTHDSRGTNFQDWRGPRSTIVSIAFTWREGLSAVVPLYHIDNPWDRDWFERATRTFDYSSPKIDRVLKQLKPYLERKGVKYVAHNGKFDNRWLASKGIFVPQTFDTMLAAHMLDENRLKGLKPLSQLFLGADAYDAGVDLANAHAAPMKRLCIYNGRDTDYTLRLYRVFREQLIESPRQLRVFAKLMMPANDTLTRVERRGMWLDPERLHARTKEAARVEHLLRIFLSKHVPKEKRGRINYNSPQQVAEWLFGDLGLPIGELTGTGNPSTKESVLLQLSKQHVAPRALLKRRKWRKYIDTYLHPWAMQADVNSRLHTTYKLFGTVTGRLSSADPNMQQVPRDQFIRSIIGAPPGWKFLEADFSQVELRIAAMLARETRMLRAFLTGRDLHRETAASVSGKRPEDITSEERKKAKAVNFGFLYGMGAAKFVSYALDNYDVEVSLDEAEAIRRKFFDTYPALRPWHDRQRRLANRYGHVHSPIGRRRTLPGVQSGDKDVRAESERQAINSPVQSMASDLMLLSLVRLDRALPVREARVVGTVHDSILFEVRDEAVASTVEEIRKTMEDPTLVRKLFGTQLTVPIEVEIKVGQHWGEGEVV